MSEIKSSIQKIERFVENPEMGLPEEIFEWVSTVTPLVNVDLLIKDKNKGILMIWRDDDICGKGWHIPGGIVRFKEPREERIRKTAIKELNTEISFDKEPIAVNEIFMPAKIRGHFISFLYQCYLPDSFAAAETMEKEEDDYPSGTRMWHTVSPKNWVKGQRDVYEKLFSDKGIACNKSFFEQNYSADIIKADIMSGKCTFTFDIDGVIANINSSLQYDQETPINDMINIINKLYRYGNQIILFTARGTKTGIDWSEVTSRQMNEWGVCYHELRFGKPAASFYIDDKNMDINFLYSLDI